MRRRKKQADEASCGEDEKAEKGALHEEAPFKMSCSQALHKMRAKSKVGSGNGGAMTMKETGQWGKRIGVSNTFSGVFTGSRGMYERNTQCNGPSLEV